MKKSFSQRMGLEPATKPFQTDSMTRELRTSLWNAFVTHANDEAALRALWVNFFKWSQCLDPLELLMKSELKRMEEWLLDERNMPWNRVYEFVEFVAELKAAAMPKPRSRSKRPPPVHPFITDCNDILEREHSAYHFVGTVIGPFTNDAEIKAIERAASMGNSPLAPVSIHIDAALKRLSDKKQPDYRNSIKESISAVEAICKIIAKKDKATLADALGAIAAKVKLHPAQRKGFEALYGYTNDAQGIRHALTDDGQPEPEDAKYMLVSCSGFVNYLIEKARKNGLLPT